MRYVMMPVSKVDLKKDGYSLTFIYDPINLDQCFRLAKLDPINPSSGDALWSIRFVSVGRQSDAWGFPTEKMRDSVWDDIMDPEVSSTEIREVGSYALRNY